MLKRAIDSNCFLTPDHGRDEEEEEDDDDGRK